MLTVYVVLIGLDVSYKKNPLRHASAFAFLCKQTSSFDLLIKEFNLFET